MEDILMLVEAKQHPLWRAENNASDQLDIYEWPSSGPQSLCLGRKSRSNAKGFVLLATLFATTLPVISAQLCLPLEQSEVCPAFKQASISTNSGLVSTYPWLAYVSNIQQFDSQLTQYIATNYAQQKYQQLLGCTNIDLQNTTNLYARYTTSVICNAIVQNSKTPCKLSDEDSRPLCADSCAEQAISEEEIITNNSTCMNPGPAALDQIRADFTVCSLPSDSLGSTCITGEQNEPENCGFSTNLLGLCSYCASSAENSTYDSCCIYSNATTRCANVHLPITSTMPALFPGGTSTSKSTTTAATPSAAHSSGDGLSGGQIAGIVVGSVVGAALLLGVLLLCCLRRRKRDSPRGSVFNQPSPPRKGGKEMVYNPANTSGAPQQGYEVLPGGRVARMSALEGPSSDSPPHDGLLAGGVVGGAHRRNGDNSSSSEYRGTPESHDQYGAGMMAPPSLGQRTASLSSGSMLGRGEGPNSPHSGSGGQYSSPEGVASGQSEQLPLFKDYYSQDEIRPNDKVATLWAYQPRAGDEFELERGDMLKVVGIWDDGWATGVRINDRAEDWEARRQMQRDSGVSNGPGQRDASPSPPGEIKAFPLVCVCLPEHWRKTIEGDGSTEAGSSGGQHPTGLL
ncbi:MAG: hypothetical protein M1827_002423 [Pycnora praestabilis]|nr:MAG: hypothetical protein M1827_002423 [Pycnora praestabilis]